VATNAGGNSVIRYGMTREAVLGLEVVLADGTVMSSMNHMLKNNSGYDLKHLFVGSEGTLGIITRIVLRLREAQGPAHTALIGCRQFAHLLAMLRLFDQALHGQLSAFEVMWQDYFELAVAGSPSKQSPLKARYPFYVLVDCTGSTAEALQEALSMAAERELAGEIILAQSEAQRKALWALRESVGETFKHGPDFAFDISLPLAAMEAYAQTLRTEVKQRWPDGHCWIFGHLGDGNLHVSLAVGRGDAQTRFQLETLVYEPLRKLGGAVSAEHGIGLEKKAWLNVARSAEELTIMRKLKQLFDPYNLLNRGKTIDPSKLVA
jgi:FAD/FMN-containing dehydrogenase